MSDQEPPQAYPSKSPNFIFETERETDGRWIAEIPEVPGALAYGETEKHLKAKAQALAMEATLP